MSDIEERRERACQRVRDIIAAFGRWAADPAARSFLQEWVEIYLTRAEEASPNSPGLVTLLWEGLSAAPEDDRLALSCAVLVALHDHGELEPLIPIAALDYAGVVKLVDLAQLFLDEGRPSRINPLRVSSERSEMELVTTPAGVVDALLTPERAEQMLRLMKERFPEQSSGGTGGSEEAPEKGEREDGVDVQQAQAPPPREEGATRGTGEADAATGMRRPVRTAEIARAAGMRTDLFLKRLRARHYPIGGVRGAYVVEYEQALAALPPRKKRQVERWADENLPHPDPPEST